MEAISFKEVVIHWADMVVNQALPLFNAMCHVFTGAIIYAIGHKFGKHG
jgi:hypothetical protein